MILQELAKKAYTKFQGTTLKVSSKIFIEPLFFDYGDLLLKTYLEIGKTGNYRLLIKQGDPTIEMCYEAWERLVKESNKASGNWEFVNYIDDLKALNQFLNEWNYVRAMLLQCLFVVDDQVIETLQGMGYVIDTTNRITYAQTVGEALQQSKGIHNRIRSKAKKINAVRNREGQKDSQDSYGSMVGRLNLALGFQVDETTLTLERYTEYKKLLEEKFKRHGRNKQV